MAGCEVCAVNEILSNEEIDTLLDMFRSGSVDEEVSMPTVGTLSAEDEVLWEAIVAKYPQFAGPPSGRGTPVEAPEEEAAADAEAEPSTGG